MSNPVQRNSLTKEFRGDMSITMQTTLIEQRLRELVKENGLRKTAHDLGIDHASLYRSLRDGSNIKLERIKQLLDYLGYEIRFVKLRKRRGRK
jgi:DNA-binding phage protein